MAKKMVRHRGPGIHLVSGFYGKNVEFSEEINDLTTLLKEVSKKVKGIKGLTHDKMGRYIKRQIQERFEKGGQGPGDTSEWPGLRDSTRFIRRYQKLWPGKGGHQPIKRKTLALQNSIRIWKGKGKGIVRVGSAKRYVAFQEVGGNIEDAPGAAKSDIDDTSPDFLLGQEGIVKKGINDKGKEVNINIPLVTRVPARPAIYFNQKMIDDLTNIVANYIVTRFEKNPETAIEIFRKVGG